MNDLMRVLAALPQERFVWLCAVSGAVGVASLAWSFVQLHRARALEDMPTSRIRSAAQGYVELSGRVRWMPGPEIVSPLSRKPCCWWSYRIERLESSSQDGRRHRNWELVESATSDDLFLLGDATGDCVVDPEGAEVIPSLRRRWQGRTRMPERVPPKTPWFSHGQYRYTERLLCLGDDVHALGWFRTQGHEHRFDESADLRALLAEWKRDRRELLRRFDADGNGEIDAAEWENARRAALEIVRADQVQRSVDPDVHVLCNPPDSRRFLLSSVPEAELVRKHKLSAAAFLALAGAAAALILATVKARGLI